MENMTFDVNDDISSILSKKLAYHTEQYKLHKRQTEEVSSLISSLKESKANESDNRGRKSNSSTVPTTSLEDRNELKIAAFKSLESLGGGPALIADIYIVVEEDFPDIVKKIGSAPCKQMLSSFFSNWAISGRVNPEDPNGKKTAIQVSKDETMRNLYCIVVEETKETEVSSTPNSDPEIGVITQYRRLDK